MRAAAKLGLLAAFAGCNFDTSGIATGPDDPDGSADAATEPDLPPDASATDAAPPDATPPDATPIETPQPVHLYTFSEGTAEDVAGSADGVLREGVVITDGAAVFSADDPGWIELPAGEIAISSFDEVTFEAWFTYEEAADWQRIYDFGARSDDLAARNTFFTPTSPGDTRAVIANGDPGFDNEAVANVPFIAAEQEHHIAVTLNAEEIALFIDGSREALVAYDAAESPAPSIDQLSDDHALLGRSLYEADAPFRGTIRQFAIFDVVLAPEDVLRRFEEGPP